MTSNSSSGNETEVVAFAEGATKVTVAAAALCYAIGFVTVNVYLGTLGASLNPLASTEYVLAGVAWTMMIALAGVPSIILFRLTRIHFHTSAWLRFAILTGAALLLFAFQAGVLFIALDFLSGNTLAVRNETTWFAVATLLVTPFLIGLVSEPLLGGSAAAFSDRRSETPLHDYNGDPACYSRQSRPTR